MIINNSYGSNEELRELCKALGVSQDVSEQVDALEEDKVRAALSKPHEWYETALGDALYVGIRNEDGGPDISIRIGADEGPHIDLVSKYISRMLLMEKDAFRGEVKIETVMKFLYKSLITPLEKLGLSQDEVDGQMELWRKQFMDFLKEEKG